ncbi:MAG TPA: lamin tail domain-containing protein [Candidatus Saccharimonadales bacterium]|nr:lamin tail domain-containing protein [Candidatus Saccharimonadales bacterium]
MLQPFFSLPAYASTIQPGEVVINELSTQPGWVELYNMTETPITLTGWRLQSKTQTETINTVLASHGFVVVNITLETSGDMIRLFDEGEMLINEVAYSEGSTLEAPGALQSLARRVDGGAVWAVGTSTKGFSNKTDFLSPSVPGGGAPNDTAETTLDFAFSWQPASDNSGPVTYEFRMATSPELLGSGFSSGVDGTSIAFRNNIDAGDGEWYWQVRAVDQSQNYSDWSTVWRVRVDTNGPGITIERPGMTELFGGPMGQTIPFQASIIGAREETPFTLELDGTDVTQQVSSAWDNEGRLHITGSFTAGNLNEGIHILKLRAIDDVGNPGEQVLSFVVDRSAPELSTNIGEGAIVEGKVQVTLMAQEEHPGEYDIAIEHSGKSVTMDAKDQSDTAETESGSTVLSYLWDTKTEEDGVYEIRFRGVDAAGNEAFLTRTVTVDNTPGGGSLVLSSQAIDPLLDQLSKQLAQPFVVPKPLDLPSVEVVNTSDQLSSTARTTPVSLPATDQNTKLTAVAPTESGWRIFGVLWYWWFLLIVTIIVTFYRARRAVRTPLPDSV